MKSKPGRRRVSRAEAASAGWERRTKEATSNGRKIGRKEAEAVFADIHAMLGILIRKKGSRQTRELLQGLLDEEAVNEN